MASRPDPAADEIECAEVFARLGDDRRAGRYRDAVRSLLDYLHSEPDNSAGRRLELLLSIGSLVTADALRARIPARSPAPGEFWSLQPVTVDAEETSSPDDVAALRALVAELNGDHSAALDVIAAHLAVTGPEGILPLLGSMVSLYVATVDGDLPCSQRS
ncbi:hypothetical protein GCM10010174_61990 [Kutzneria viridogrisea]|uniref:Tetratricopeptide repeat protein n=1 Tax=Kutzneria viridogrisea TaxID=47990 RepID=A0ABR6BG81_9PSEU|nr:hypothetical protein [Kutzneria viridogrisea]